MRSKPVTARFWLDRSGFKPEAVTSNPESVDAVINNMLNRVGSKGWGPSRNHHEVAMAPGQYAGHRHATAKEAAFIRSRIEAIASGGVPDNTHGSNAYRASWYHGPWFRHHPEGMVVGGNRFAYEHGVKNGPYAPFSDATVAQHLAAQPKRAEEAGPPMPPRRQDPVPAAKTGAEGMTSASLFDHGNIDGAIHRVRALRKEIAELGDASISVISGARGGPTGPSRSAVNRRLRGGPSTGGSAFA